MSLPKKIAVVAASVAGLALTFAAPAWAQGTPQAKPDAAVAGSMGAANAYTAGTSKPSASLASAATESGTTMAARVANDVK
jgi:hypothetical protein